MSYFARVEVKSGKQVEPIATRFYQAEAQSDASKPIGDPRPFLMVAMPQGTTDGIFLGRLSDFPQMKELLDGTA